MQDRRLYWCRSANIIEELREDAGAVFAEHSAVHRRPVAVVFLEEVYHAADGAASGLARAVDDGGEPGVDYGPGAHGAGFERDGYAAAGEVPSPARGAGVADGLDLGVGAGVAGLFAPVSAAAYDLAALVKYHAAHGDLAHGRGLACKRERLAHILFVVQNFTTRSVFMLSILLIGVGLSMDAFAASVTSGLTVKGFGPKHAALLGLYFGGFQFLMPLLGYLLGSTVSSFVSAYAPYISFFLLAFVGIKMLVEAIKGGETAVCTQLRHSQLLVMAIATSLDALAVGVSFAFMPDVSLLPSCLLIGCTTFVLCFAGGLVGGKIPGISCKTSGILGGLVLCGIGVKLLIEGLAG